MTDAEESLLSLESCHSPVSIPRHFSPPPRHSSPPTSGEAEAGLLPRVPPPPKKCHLIFCPPLTGFFRLISVVNSFTPRRFEGSPAGSPAQKVHCTTTHCTSHAAHCALCTLHTVHSSKLDISCTWLQPTAPSKSVKVKVKA